MNYRSIFSPVSLCLQRNVRLKNLKSGQTKKKAEAEFCQLWMNSMFIIVGTKSTFLEKSV